MQTSNSMESYENPYACAACEESFSKPSSLVSHVQSKHESIKLSKKRNEKERNDSKIQGTCFHVQ